MSIPAYKIGRLVLDALDALGSPSTVLQVCDQISSGKGDRLSEQTIRRHLNALEDMGLVDKSVENRTYLFSKKPEKS